MIHEETFYPVSQNGPSGAVTPLDLSLYQQKVASANDPVPFHPLQAIPFLDYENENDNPVEDKYRTLAHDLLRGLVDPALKPDRVQRDRLAAIIASPSHHPSREDKGKFPERHDHNDCAIFAFSSIQFKTFSRSSMAIQIQPC